MEFFSYLWGNMKYLILFALLFFSFSGDANGDTFPRVYNAHHADSAIEIDGRLDDKAWQKAEKSEYFISMKGVSFPAPEKKTSMKMLWDDNCLYIAAILEEDDIRATMTEHDSVIWHENAFEVFLDPYNDGQIYYEFEINSLGTVMDIVVTKPYSKGGQMILGWECKGMKIAVHCDGTINDPSDSDNFWSVELAIPFTSISREHTAAKDQKTWRVNFTRVDWPSAGVHNSWAWSPTGNDIHIPELWGYLNFIE